MKICLIHSAEDGSDIATQTDEFADPRRYIDQSHHEFVSKWVTKANAKSEIDSIVKEGFDFYMNYMCGNASAAGAGLEATQYLESKNVTILTGSSKLLVKDVLDLEAVAQNSGLHIPLDTPGKYPKTVRYANSHRIEDEDHICDDDESVKNRVSLLTKGKSSSRIVVQDYVSGSDFSVIVIEMGQKIVALPPIRILKDSVLGCDFVEDESKENIQKIAEEASRALGIAGHGGWARVNLRQEEATRHLFVIGISALPSIFYPEGNKFGDDFVIKNKFPGGHAALMEMMLATKQMQLKRHQEQNDHIAGVFDEFSNEYDSAWRDSGLHKIQKFLAAEFDYSGTVLDIACGAGAVGTVLHEAGIPAEVTGIEFSKGMLNSPYIKKHYKEPLRIGAMQELIMGAGEFDHVVCFGALQFVDREHLIAMLSRMFMLAQKSISFGIDDVEEDYVKLIQKHHGEMLFNANHVQAVQEFGVPLGWKQVYNNRALLFDVPEANLDVYGYIMRFERI